MVISIPARDVSLYELEEKFGLQLTTEPTFFREWSDNLPSITDAEKQSLLRVRSNYSNLTKRRPMSEEAVKMVVLSPLLDLAGFYQTPFEIETETAIEISAENEGVVVKGNIDVLVVQKQLWILVIEAKSTKFDVITALSQALAYMLGNLDALSRARWRYRDRPTYGLLVNGREFVFLKLIQQ